MICPNCGFETKTARNNSQNSLFHLWMRLMADELGYPSLEDVKRDIKRQILGVKEIINRITGEIQYEDYKTSMMSMRDMAAFMDKIKIWALTDLNIHLPYEKEDGYDELMEHYK